MSINATVDKNKATAILGFSELFLTSNYLKFLGQSYLQKSGTAMGTKMAPTYANLFIGQFEKKMFVLFPLKPLVNFRYIDHIFMIWTDDRSVRMPYIKNYIASAVPVNFNIRE